MQTKPLNIHIPKPCSQNFAEMPKQGDGLYCGQCTKIVYDFSMMTDYELLQFFKTKPDVHCGKFHNSQLNRNIEPVIIKNKLLHKISAIAASVLALVALKPNTAKAQGVVAHIASQTDKTTNTTTAKRDSINIKGVVKNEKGEALQNALVKMDRLGEIKTDINGVYDFGFIAVESTHNIYYSCPNYVPVVRSYNAVMGNTVMDIVMGHRDSNAVVFNGHTGGAIMFENINMDLSTSLLFKKNSLLCSDGKAILNDVASKLKSNPEANITISAYSKIKTNSKIAEKRVAEILKYLVKMQGISEDRISTNLEINSAKADIVEIR